MKHLATTIVDALAFLELSGDDVIDPDSAVAAMELLAAHLQQCSSDERAALRSAVNHTLQAERNGRNDPATVEFLENFFDSFGIE